MLTINVKDFTLKDTFECGQCFRYIKINDYEYYIQTKNIVARLKQINNSLQIFSTYEDMDFWNNYLDLNTNYSDIIEKLNKDVNLAQATNYGRGIHILKQNFHEMIISYIMSQNKQIPQIQQCIELFCQKYGNKIEFEENTFSSFPSSFQNITLDGLKECKVGFRDKYIMNAIQKIDDGYFGNIEELLDKEIEQKLLNIKGIGPKVMNCIMLFGLYKTNRFPIDTWIKKKMQNLYFDGQETKNEDIERKANELFGEYKGYAQQYLFYAGRNGII